MQIGAIFPAMELQPTREEATAYTLGVESLGFHHIIFYDHVLGASHEGRERPLGGPWDETTPLHDPLVLCAFLAGITARIEVATGVLILPQRQTALVARQTADIDILSDGRFRLGIGIGWNPVEYDALGQDFTKRGKREEEQIGLLRRLWTEPLVEFSGAFDRVDRAALVPRPTRSIPIWLGGRGSVALPRAARFGDGFLFSHHYPDPPGDWKRLREMLDREGRDPSTFGAELYVSSPNGPPGVTGQVERWEAAGGTHAAVNTVGMGLGSLDDHLAYLADVSTALNLRQIHDRTGDRSAWGSTAREGAYGLWSHQIF